MIPYGRQQVSEEDIAAVEAVLRSDFLTQGPVVPRFEEAVARYCTAAHAVAVNSATSALHLACLALDLGPGSTLWTSPNTFVASANCARYCGAAVGFVDVEPDTGNMSVDALAVKLEEAERNGRLPAVVMPVHFAGEPCDMAAIGRLGERYGYRIIEDASHAIGARCDGDAVGAGRHSDITVFSFHPVKIITSGEGGLAATNNTTLAERLRRLRSHGITRDAAQMEGDPDGPWYYQQLELGFNYRLTDIHAALGLSQLTRLETFIERRHAAAARYDRALRGLPLCTPSRAARHRSALHLYSVQLADPGRRRAVFDGLRKQGVAAGVHYIPVHLQPYYRRLGFRRGQFPAAETFYERALSLPLFPAMTEAEQEAVIEALGVQLSRSG